jgi:hypothetical protein
MTREKTNSKFGPVRCGSRRGQAMVEYILLVGVVVGVVALLGKTMDTKMTEALRAYVAGIAAPKAASGGKAMRQYYQTNSNGFIYS